MSCSPCKTSENTIEGWIGPCPDCGELRWYNGSEGQRLFPVPGLKGGKLPITRVDDERDSLVRDLKTPRRIRLTSDKRGEKKDHIENLLGLDNPRGKYKEKYSVYKDHISELGLDLTQLVQGSEIRESEPLLIHWAGQDPFDSFPNIKACPDGRKSANSGVDTNWGSYKLDMNMHEGLFGFPFKKGQKTAIDQILKNTGSRQIVALPTGYGKTRIVQTVTNILRKSEKGPTLMISPIIALRDDQREAFMSDFEGNSKVFGREFKGKFITAEDDDIPEIIDDLIEDKLDILCCAPEHLLNPGQNMSWIEVFMRMKNPFSTLVVDEAHLIGDWGSTFRPHFLLLGQLKDRMVEMNPDLRVLLQSATITKEEGNELEGLFDRLTYLPEVREDDVRDDLFFNVNLEKPEFRSLQNKNSKKPRKTIDYESSTLQVLEEYEDMPGPWRSPWDDSNDSGRSPLLIYSAEETGAKDIILPKLKDENVNARSYTGSTDEKQRDRLRVSFKRNKIEAMVATSAFGMGIDKPDVWLISYLGLPYTLKGLYQGFGRAARGSNWDGKIPDKPFRNGCCVATLPDENPNLTRRFRPELRLELAAERLWDMMMSDSTLYVGDRGYLIAPVLDKLHAPLWLQSEKEVADYVKRSESEEQEQEDEDDDITGWVAPTMGEWEKAERAYELGRRSSLRTNLKYRMWSLACLQRKRKVSILGFYPETLYVDQKEGLEMRLESSLREGGHGLVIDNLKKIEPPKIGTPEGQRRCALVMFNEPVSSWDDVLRMLEEGHDDLRKRHNEGNQILGEFLNEVREGGCLRKAFAPAIGASSSPDCLTLLNRWRSSESEVRRKNPPVPCKNCLDIEGIPKLEMSGNGSALWLEESNLLLLRGEELPPSEKKDPLDESWSNVPDPENVIKSRKDGDDILWQVAKNELPDKFYDTHAEEYEVEISVLEDDSGIYKIDNVPRGTAAIVIFSTKESILGRFIDEQIFPEMEDEWNHQ